MKSPLPNTVSLPVPNADQLTASTALLLHIQDAIAAVGGWLPFADYMRLALYTPGLGYYSGGSHKFGVAGDFVTAPELSPLFGRALAQPVAQVLAEAGGDVLEVGAGSGRLAVDLLGELQRLGQLPVRYRILELSAELAARQRDTIAHELPALLDRVEWLASLPVAFQGCIIGNEVLDAMPCQLVRWRDGVWWERGVVWQGGLQWQDRLLCGDVVIDTNDIADAYLTEIQLEAQAFVASLADVVTQGALILVDYGFAAREYYHPQRSEGTLMCHYRHHSYDDPFYLPGLADITTHIDFSAIWRAADAAGWRLEGYASQAAFLIDAGIMDQLDMQQVDDPAHIRTVAALHKLVSPAEMGELFKTMAFSKNMSLPNLLAGFRGEDRSGGL